MLCGLHDSLGKQGSVPSDESRLRCAACSHAASHPGAYQHFHRQALGLTVPTAILVRADEVIE
jgi:hypothetical protein